MQERTAEMHSPGRMTDESVQAVAVTSPRHAHVAQLAADIASSPRMTAQYRPIAQLKGVSTPMHGKKEKIPLQGKFDGAHKKKALQKKTSPARLSKKVPVQKQITGSTQKQDPGPANRSGLPIQLKRGIEALSGMSMDHVRVHYGSSEPARLNAHAYAQGHEIHLARGKEQHLPHEAWHVVQQAQGRVRPTMQAAGRPVNDDQALEREADVMGRKAMSGSVPLAVVQPMRAASNIAQRVVSVREQVLGFSELWGEVQKNRWFRKQELEEADLEAIKKILESWVSAPAKSALPFRTSENRTYGSTEELCRGLVGEYRGQHFKQAEIQLAEMIFNEKASKSRPDAEGAAVDGLQPMTVTDSANSATTKPRTIPVTDSVNSAMTKLRTSYAETIEGLGEDAPQRYKYHYGGLFAGSLKSEVLSWSPSKSLEATIALILDLSLAIKEESQVRENIEKLQQDLGSLSKEQSDARSTHWNPKESAAWTKAAREANVPLSAGPSATTGQTLKVMRGAELSSGEMGAVATAAHAFWATKAFRHKSGIHTQHEVLDVLNYHLSLVLKGKEKIRRQKLKGKIRHQEAVQEEHSM